MDAQKRMTQANEDYLEAVYELAGGTDKPVRSVDLANKLGVSKASVNKAVSVLKANGYVEQEPYGDVFLTKQGAEYGRSVFRRHLALFHFLTDVLGVEAEVAEDEACMMEHAISDGTLDKWIEFMEREVPESVKAVDREE